VPAHPIEGLRVGDAMVNRKISPEDITIVHDNYATTPSLESVAGRMAETHGSKLAVKFNPYHRESVLPCSQPCGLSLLIRCDELPL
jgi:hypothetical protein